MAVPYVALSTTSSSGSASYTYTFTHAVAVGDGLAVQIGQGGATPPGAVSVTDSKGNLWFLTEQSAVGSAPYMAIFTCDVKTALTTSDTFTLTYTGNATGGFGVIAIGVPGQPAIDVRTASATGTSVTPSITATVASAGTTAVSFMAWANAGLTGATNSPFTRLAQAQPAAGTWSTISYDSGPATGSLTSTATITSATWRAAMIVFKAPAPVYMSAAAYINSMDASDHAHTLQFFGGSQNFSINNSAGSITALPAGYSTTPVLKYISYGQFWADVTGVSRTISGITYTPVAIAGGYTWLMYDTEVWSPNPPSPYLKAEAQAEMDDPWTYMASFVTLAHANGYKVMLPPARDLGNDTSSVNVKLAGESLDAWYLRTGLAGSAATSGAEIVEVQAQADQQNLTNFYGFWGPALQQIRSSGPIAKGFVGLSTTYGTATDMANAAKNAANTADGYWVNALTTSTAVSFLQIMATSGGVTITFTPTSLPGGTVGTAYSQTVTASGGTAPYTYVVTSGALPAGLSLNTSTGAITGTPTTAATSSFTITATDAGSNTGSQAYSITVSALQTGTPYLIGNTAAASGGGTNLVVSVSTTSNNLDTILVGVLVTAAGVTPTVADSAGNTYALLQFDTVNTTTQLFIFESDGSNALIAGTDTVTVSYSANTSNQGAIVVGDNGTSGSDKAVIAHGTSTAPNSGSSGVLSQASEHAIAFIVDTNAGGTPAWATPWSSHVLSNITSNAATKLSAAYQTVNATTALTASGTITSAAWAAGEVTTKVGPVNVTLAMSNGVQNATYSQTLEANGGVGPYTWTIPVGTLPAGLSLTSGVVSGTPTVNGTFTFTTRATDSLGIPGDLVQTIVILPNVVSGAPSVALANNLLSAGDSDAEVAATWAGDVNANTPTRSTNIALTGTRCHRWTSVADGLTQVATGFYNVQSGSPYIASGFVLPAGARDCQLGIQWFTSGSILIRQDLGTSNPSVASAWEPIVFNGTAPANATKCKLVVTIQQSNAGDQNHIDLLYIAQSGAQVLVDWINPSFADGGSAGQDFMDVSSWLRMDVGISMNRGRQDAISEIQPGSVSYTLQNDGGIFTRRKSNSLVYVIGGAITLHRRYQINLADENGVWYTRADGSISDATYSFDNTGNTSILQINGTDVLAYMNRQDALSCWTKETVLATGPLYHWSLNDAGNTGGAGLAAETSGNNGPPLRVWNSDNTKTATIGWQDSSGGVETLANAIVPGQPDGGEFWQPGSNQPTSQIRGLDSGAVGPYSTPIGAVYLTPKLTATASANWFTSNIGYQLQTALPTPINPAATDYSFECWFTMDPGIKTSIASKFGPYVPFSLGYSLDGSTMVGGIFLNGVSPHTFKVNTYGQPPGFLGKNFTGNAPPATTNSITTSLPADTVVIPHHLVVVISQSLTAPTVTAYLDGVQFASSFTLPAGQKYDTVCFGGTFGASGCHWGAVSLASVYNRALSQSEIITHCQMGQYGSWEQTTDDCIATLSSFAGAPGFWANISGNHTGLSLTEYQDITGSNAIAMMQTYERAEGGLLFVNSSGQLNFHTRDWRMGHGAPDLLLGPDTFDGTQISYGIVDQFMNNEMGVATQVFQTGASFVNHASQDNYGVYTQNSVNSPLQLPLISWSRAFGQLGLTSFYYFSDPNLDDRAAWEANSHAEPWMTPASLTVDLLTLNKSTTGLGISDFYGLEIDSLIAPDGILPVSFPDASISREWFIEGIQETLTQTSHSISFYTSPAETQRAWIPGDGTYGVLGATSRIGISQADIGPEAADGKDTSHDAGRPYWPPKFGNTMNNPAATGHGFVGGLDMRGLTDNLDLMLSPPMLVVGATGQSQTMPSGSNSTPQIFWDTVFVDTQNGMGLMPGWPNWYVVTVPGFYDIDASLVWASGTVNAGTTVAGWIIVAQAGAQNLAAGTGTPVTNGNYICPIGEQTRVNAASQAMANAPSTRMYLGVGDMVTIGAEQSTTASRNTATGVGGSKMSLVWRGWGQTDDRCQINSTIAGAGGTVTTKKTTTTYNKQYGSTHTYCYYGSSINYNRKNQDGDAFQGTYSGGGNVTGSDSSQIIFDHGQINADLNVAGSVSIKSVQLQGQNKHGWYNTGARAVLGYSTQTPGGNTFDPHSVSNRGVVKQWFNYGQTLKFNLPSSFAQSFQGSGKFILLGNGYTTDLNEYGYWKGGPNAWWLYITYTVTV